MNLNDAIILEPCLLDKLIDEEPEKRLDTPKSNTKQLNDFYAGVRRDLELLLNTRCSDIDYPEHYHHLDKSLFTYGISDFMNESLVTDRQKELFCQALVEKIELFEPRLKSVQVFFIDQELKADRTIYIRIEAFLIVGDQNEHIIFDSTLDPGTSHITITKEFIE